MGKETRTSSIQTAHDTVNQKLFNLDSRILTKVLSYFQLAITTAILPVLGNVIIRSVGITLTGLSIIEHNSAKVTSNSVELSSGIFSGSTKAKEVPLILTFVWMGTIALAFSIAIQLWAALRLLKATNEVPLLKKLEFIQFWYFVNAIYTVVELGILLFLLEDLQNGLVVMLVRVVGFIVVANYVTFLTKSFTSGDVTSHNVNVV